MNPEAPRRAILRELFPSRSIALLLGIGFVDLVATAVLHAQGLIQELNPLMKGLIEHSEWLFALVKGITLALGWTAMVWYARVNLGFVRKACLAGSLAYVSIWTFWFFFGQA